MPWTALDFKSPNFGKIDSTRDAPNDPSADRFEAVLLSEPLGTRCGGTRGPRADFAKQCKKRLKMKNASSPPRLVSAPPALLQHLDFKRSSFVTEKFSSSSGEKSIVS